MLQIYSDHLVFWSEARARVPLSRCHNGFSPPEQLGSCRIFVRHTGCKQRTFRPICRTDSTLQVHISNNKRSRCISFHEYKSTNPGKQYCHSHQGCEKISKRAVPRVAHRHVACKRVTRAAISSLSPYQQRAPTWLVELQQQRPKSQKHLLAWIRPDADETSERLDPKHESVERDSRCCLLDDITSTHMNSPIANSNHINN